MFPFPEGYFAPRNQWYVAAWSSEVGREPIERWILDEPIALYRTEEGSPVALHGRCPHRHFPLGRSRVVGDNIQCGYHGITFRPDGSCAEIPSQEKIPNGCRVKAYPLVERWKWLWIWPGDPECADERMIPDHQELALTDPAYHFADGWYCEIPCRYVLAHDNLSDLTHINHLHRNTIAAVELRDKTPDVDSGANWVSSYLLFEDVECPAHFAKLFGYSGKVDRLFGTRMHFPALYQGKNVFSIAKNNSVRGGEFLHASLTFHAYTPATRHKTHHFFAAGCSGGDPGLAEKIVRDSDSVLREDLEAYARVEQMLCALSERPREIFIAGDKPGALVRKLFVEAIERERAGLATSGQAEMSGSLD